MLYIPKFYCVTPLCSTAYAKEGFPCSPSLATRCNVQLSNPLAIPTAGSMTLNLTVSERGRGDVAETGSIYLQSSHMALGTSKSSWTSSTSQNTVMTRRPLTCKKKTIGVFINKKLKSCPRSDIEDVGWLIKP